MLRRHFLRFVFSLLALATALRAAEPTVTAPPTATSTAETPAPARAPFVAILCAYGPELNALIQQLDLKSPEFTVETDRGFRFHRGRVGAREVVVFETGTSVVNAAMSLQLALTRYPITHVLFAGVAGGVDPSLEVGDVVIPEKWAYHDEADYFNEDGKGGYRIHPGVKQRYANFGMIFPNDTRATRASAPGFKRMSAYPADPALLAAARRALEKLGPLKGERTGRTLRIEVGGTGVSGSVFLDHAGYREHLLKVWQARCVDMESTAYAHVCYTNEVPFLAVRALSDLAGAQPGDNEIHAHQAPSSVNAVRVLRAILEEL